MLKSSARSNHLAALQTPVATHPAEQVLTSAAGILPVQGPLHVQSNQDLPVDQFTEVVTTFVTAVDIPVDILLHPLYEILSTFWKADIFPVDIRMVISDMVEDAADAAEAAAAAAAAKMFGGANMNQRQIDHQFGGANMSEHQLDYHS